MASPSVASYFNVRKRAAVDDLISGRSKVVCLDADTSNGGGDTAQVIIDRNILAKNRLVDADLKSHSAKVVERPPSILVKQSTSDRRSTRRTTKRATADTLNQPKIVKFTLGGTLSPRKKTGTEETVAFQSIKRNSTTTPTKKSTSSSSAQHSAVVVNKTLANAKKELSFDEIKSKVTKSAKLDELKAILNKRQQLEEQYHACINKRSTKTKTNVTQPKEGQSLKQFETIELEVLSRLVSFPYLTKCGNHRTANRTKQSKSACTVELIHKHNNSIKL